MLKERVTIWSGIEPRGKRSYIWKVTVKRSMWFIEVRKKKIPVA